MSPGPRAGRDREVLRPAFADAMASAAAVRGRAAPTFDAALDLAAGDIARAASVGTMPPFELIVFLLAHYGVVHPEPQIVMLRTSPEGESQLPELGRARLDQVYQSGEWNRVGLGVARAPDSTTVILAFQHQVLELQPVPRRVPARGTIRLSGRIPATHRAPDVVVTLPSGAVRQVPVTQNRGRFEAAVPCAAGSGAYQVEVTAEDARGPGVLANFPVYCGVAPPGRAPTGAAEVTPDDPRDVEEELFALVNQERARIRLPALRWDRRLADIARAHSRDMASIGDAMHVSPTTGGPAERVTRAGLRPTLVMENVARAHTAGQVHRGLMASPGHRGAIIDPRPTHVGIGVELVRDDPSGPVLFVTQLFAAGL